MMMNISNTKKMSNLDNHKMNPPTLRQQSRKSGVVVATGNGLLHAVL